MRLFEPLQLGPLTLPNRVLMAPLTRCRAKQPGTIPWELNAQYYAQRSSAGLIFSEATQICPEGQGYLWTPGMYGAEQVDGWRLVTDAVHAAGGRIHAQLWHVGRISHRSLQPGNIAPVSCCDIASNSTCFAYDSHGNPNRLDCDTPRALTSAEIPGVIAQYTNAARIAKEAGFDGVQVHGANGYLPDQFLSPVLNTRTDDWGGSAAKRAKFLLDATRACISVWGAQRVGVRLSPASDSSGMQGNTQWREQHLEVARQLQHEGVSYVDLLSHSQAAGKSGFEEEFLREFRSIFHGVLFLSGGMTRDMSESHIRDGLCDAAVFGRAFISNPDLPMRLLRNVPLTEGDPTTYYGGVERGYTDYARAT